MRLGHAVTAVETGDDVVRVRGDAFELAARRGVVAVPLGVLKRGTPAFLPELSPRKTHALAAVGFSRFEKVVLAFAEPFWERVVGRRHVIHAPAVVDARRRASKSSSRSTRRAARRRRPTSSSRSWAGATRPPPRRRTTRRCACWCATPSTRPSGRRRPRGTVVACFGRGGRGTSSRAAPTRTCRPARRPTTTTPRAAGAPRPRALLRRAHVRPATMHGALSRASARRSGALLGDLGRVAATMHGALARRASDRYARGGQAASQACRDCCAQQRR